MTTTTLPTLSNTGLAHNLPADSPLGRALEQPMLLGLFLPIHNGGWSISHHPRATDWTYAYNAKLTQQAEQAGFDLVFGPAHWLGKGGFGGEMRYRETSLDSFVAATALAAITQRILVISTVHVLYGPWHPLHLAKFGATLDHIANGRWGLNIVTGFRKDEWAMFGQQQIEHDTRYEVADEFTELLLKLWRNTENLTWRGPNYILENAFVTPKPVHGRPILVTATSSAAGIAAAVKHSDLVFVTSPGGADIDAALEKLPALNASVKRAAAEHGRHVRTLINPLIICRDTEKEARDLYAAILKAADREALAGFLGSHRTGDSKSWQGFEPDHRVVGGNLQLIGTPEQVVANLIRLKAAGCDGIQICFFDYEPDLAYFTQRVLPLMKQAGLRIDAHQVT